MRRKIRELDLDVIVEQVAQAADPVRRITEHYGLMACDRYRDLPGLMAAYLVAYVEHFSPAPGSD